MTDIEIKEMLVRIDRSQTATRNSIEDMKFRAEARNYQTERRVVIVIVLLAIIGASALAGGFIDRVLIGH